MCSGWRCGAPIRCHYTRCLRIPLAGGERSCAQNQPRCSHSPYRSRAENIIRFERLGAVITSSQREIERKSPVIRQSLFRSCIRYRFRRSVNRRLLLLFCLFSFSFFFLLPMWNFLLCFVTFCEEGAVCSVHRECWLRVLAPACNVCADAKTHRPVQN